MCCERMAYVRWIDSPADASTIGEGNDNYRKRLTHEEHLSERERLRVCNRQERTGRIQVGHTARGAAMKLQLRGGARGAQYLDIAPEHALRMTGAKCFHGRFFRGEPAGEMGCRVPPPRRVRDLSVGEYAAEKPIAVSRDGRFNAVNFGCIHAETDNGCTHVPSTA